MEILKCCQEIASSRLMSFRTFLCPTLAEGRFGRAFSIFQLHFPTDITSLVISAYGTGMNNAAMTACSLVRRHRTGASLTFQRMVSI